MEDWSRDRRDTLVLIGATLLTFLPHAPYLPAWASAGFLALFGWRLTLTLTGRPLPPDLLRWLAAIVGAAAVFWQFGTLLGREPGVCSLVLLLGLKLLELRARRDLFVVIFLGFFLLLTSFFESQSVPSAIAVLVAVAGLLTAMLTMQSGTREPSIPARLRTVGLLMLQALPVAALLFVLFPRVPGPLWRMPVDANRAVTGLSDSMSPGQIASLAESDAVAFRVRFDTDPAAGAQLYWRGPVLGHYDGRTWRPSTRRSNVPGAPSVDGAPGSELRYAVTLEPSGQPWLLALEAPTEVIEAPAGGAARTLEGVLVQRDRINQRLRYVLTSRTDYRLGLDESPSNLRPYLLLPPGFNPKSVALARTWREESPDDATRIARVLRHIRTEPFRYTLEPPLLGRDAVDEFLFGSRAGFCEHYASAFVVLARAMGIPARVVTGYLGGERNPVDGFWTIRQADAHAWAEVWRPDQGWQRIDPTAAIDPSRIGSDARALRPPIRGDAWQPGLFERLRFNLDALGNAWNQWVLLYDEDRQRQLIGWLGFGDVDWKSLAGLLAGTLALVVAVLALLMFGRRPALDPAVRCYAGFCRRLARRVPARRPHETPSELLARITPALDATAARKAAEIVSLYNAIRYGPETGSRRERVRHFRRLVDEFRP